MKLQNLHVFALVMVSAVLDGNALEIRALDKTSPAVRSGDTAYCLRWLVDGETAALAWRKEGAEDPLEEEVELDGLNAPPDGPRAVLMPSVRAIPCRATDDDHGNSLACATPLASLGEGEVHGYLTDGDVDLFRVELKRSAHLLVELEPLAPGAPRPSGAVGVELYDADGRHLEADAGGWLAEVGLGAGVFYLRIVGSVGHYRLRWWID